MVRRSAYMKGSAMIVRATQVIPGRIVIYLPSNLQVGRAELGKDIADSEGADTPSHHRESTELDKMQRDDEDSVEARRPLIKKTPLPVKQILVLMLVRLAEPVSFCVIFPFVNEQVLSTGVTSDPDRVGYYSGLIESIFAVAQFSCVMQWATLSDRWGRRPVILIGLSGMTIFGILYGFSTEFWMMVATRSALGMLNGISAPMRAALSECTDDTNVAEAFSMYAFVWQIGSILGNCVGGSFSGKLGNIPLFEAHPYAPPCVVAGGISLASVILGVFLLKETNRTVASAQSPEVTDSSGYRSLHSASSYSELADSSDATTLVATSEPHSPECGQLYKPTRSIADLAAVSVSPTPTTWSIRRIAGYPAVRLFLLMQHVHHIVITGLSAVVVLFLYTPLADGGLGLSVDEIGMAMMTQGTLIMSIQWILAPWLKRRFGSHRAFKISNFWHVIAVLGCPLLRVAFLAIDKYGGERQDGRHSWSNWLSLVIWMISWLPAHVSGVYLGILTAAYAPDPKALGTVNGMSSAVTCLGRVIGPGLFGAIFAVSTERKILGGHFWWMAVAALCAASSLLSTALPDDETRTPAKLAEAMLLDEDDEDTPPTSASPLLSGKAVSTYT